MYLLFAVEIIKRLFHRLDKLLLESLRIQSKEFFVKSSNVDRHFDLVAIGNAHKTGPLVNDEPADPYGHSRHNQDHYD